MTRPVRWRLRRPGAGTHEHPSGQAPDPVVHDQCPLGSLLGSLLMSRRLALVSAVRDAAIVLEPESDGNQHGISGAGQLSPPRLCARNKAVSAVVNGPAPDEPSRKVGLEPLQRCGSMPRRDPGRPRAAHHVASAGPTPSPAPARARPCARASAGAEASWESRCLVSATRTRSCGDGSTISKGRDSPGAIRRIPTSTRSVAASANVTPDASSRIAGAVRTPVDRADRTALSDQTSTLPGGAEQDARGPPATGRTARLRGTSRYEAADGRIRPRTST